MISFKKYIYLSGLFLLLSFCFSFTFFKPKKFIPPGTVSITENFFADEAEISNAAWREFETATKIKYGKFSKEHIAVLPDTLVWRQKNSSNEPYVQYYYRHPAYRDYPVVGISYEQALAFCKWRTEKVKEFYIIRYKKDLKINYRLPSKEEWEKISLGGVDIMYGYARNSKGCILFNHRYAADSVDAANTPNNPADVTAPILSYQKNRFGIYNLFGNVAEMTAEKGICKGGGWRHLFEECRAGNDIPYTGTTAWLGFRCVCDFQGSSQ
ncbi:MAG: SUMF1/EgtB/PvdO family nonheme iron enzyme [Sphingobacteriaceae bacterium]|nr:SUMF1/EgtB/PvdO family nonheme iron enzyme [Sphingobacteriaceae bacterium]